MSKLLVAVDLCFVKHHRTVRQKPRNVFVTEHTLIFVAKGAKVFRFPDKELVIESGKARLLKRGCYLLCEALAHDHADELLSFFGDLYGRSLPYPLFTVEQNLFTQLSISDYARLSNLSLSKFKRDFQEATEQPPGKWIQAKRLEHARLLAASTKLTVGEICAESGFNNLFHFIRAYKAAYDVTPGQS